MTRRPNASGGQRPGAAFSLVELLVWLAVLAVIAVHVVESLVESRAEVGATWNEAVARNLASEALEWAAALPADAIRGPFVIEESPVTGVEQTRLLDGRGLDDPAFVRETYSYPRTLAQFHRRLEVTDSTDAEDAALLRASVTVAWNESGPAGPRPRTLRLWRLIGP